MDKHGKVEDFIANIIDNMRQIDYIKPKEIPTIDLYMDQVTTFMDEHLSGLKRFEDDKMLTKTMINNYTKNDLLPSPDKKKYSKEHMLLLIYIYYFKNVLSISDIQSIINPLTERYYKNKNISLEKIYNEVLNLELEHMNACTKDIIKKYTSATKTFEDVEGEDKEFLTMFAFICQLCIDVYIKKTMIEKMIDADVLGGKPFDVKDVKPTKKEAEQRNKSEKKKDSDKDSIKKDE